MAGGKKKRVEMHNIIGTKCDEGNFTSEGGRKPSRAPDLIL
jgi:hypothetical protein